MSRKGPSKKHVVLPDPIYGSTVVAQLINKILLDGKKSIAEDIVYSALDMVKEKSDQEPVAVLKRALDNIRPSLEVRSRRVGGATYQVPIEVRPDRRQTLGLRWLTTYARTRSPAPVVRRPWLSVSPMRSWMPPTASVLLSSAARILIRWQRLTRPSLITAGNHSP